MDVGSFGINQQADKPTNSVCIYRKKSRIKCGRWYLRIERDETEAVREKEKRERDAIHATENAIVFKMQI